MTTKVNVGLIGAGRIGQVHTENLVYRIQQTDLVTVAGVLLLSVTQDPQTIFYNENIDTVVIYSGTDTHA